VSTETPQTHAFQAEVHQVLSLVINSLYSNPEIFLRELLSNASDALDKRRFESMSRPEWQTASLEIRLQGYEDDGILTISDNGIGMSRQELIDNLGTIARSGTRAFAEKLKEAKASAQSNLIGQFGVGFYSAYLVADRVEVVSRAVGSDEAWRWTSDAKESFTVEPATRAEAGTTLTLYLRDEHKDYASDWRVRTLVERYSDYIDYPILLGTVSQEEDEEPKVEWETINKASALWRRSASEVTDEQYTTFYEHLTRDYAEPLARTHFRIEGATEFHSLLFIPKRAPFDLFDRDRSHGVKLYVRRVLIMDECEELLPPWLRFVRGVVDSDDLPLNVSRELLQDSKVTRTIRKQLVKRVLDLLDSIATDRPEDYTTLWSQFGKVLKEGVPNEPEHRERLSKLLRFETTTATEPVSLASYVERMPEDQKAIYFAHGASRRAVENAPHIEGLRRRGWEVVLLVDPVDHWLVDSLKEFDGRPLVNAMSADLDLDEKPTEEQKETADRLTTRMKDILGDRVSDIRVSTRLQDSPVCLVVPKGGLPSFIERLMQANRYDIPSTKRIMEVNPGHTVIQKLSGMVDDAGSEGTLRDWVELLYDQALLTEGSPVEDPARFASRMTSLMQQALQPTTQN